MDFVQYSDYAARLEKLEVVIADQLPALFGLIKYSETVNVHQDTLPGLSDKELYLLGAAIKVAGYWQRPFVVTGICGERKYRKPTK